MRVQAMKGHTLYAICESVRPEWRVHISIPMRRHPGPRAGVQSARHGGYEGTHGAQG